MNPILPLHLNQALKKGLSLQNFKTLQFLAEFLIFSKYGEQSPIFKEFLIATEMVKFILKLSQFYRSYRNPNNPTNVYLEKYPRGEQPQEKEKEPSNNKFERIKEYLERLKKMDFSKQDFQPEMFEFFPNGKKVQLVTSVPVPKNLQRTRLKFWQLFGEFLFIVRPLVAILAIRYFGEDSYVPYFISLFLEVLAFILQRNVKVLNPIEKVQWQSRQKDLIWRCLFKRPFFQFFKNRIIKPALGTVMAEHRFLYKIIMYIIEIQSSITLTI